MVQVFVGHRSTCFLDEQGGRWCVGEGNGVGETAGTAPNMPVHFSGDDGYTRLALGWQGGFAQQGTQLVQWGDVNAPTSYSSDTTWVDFFDDRDDYCFRHSDGTAMCDEIDMGGGWDQIDPGPNHRCGVKAGTLYCWGFDYKNVLGQGVEPDDTEIDDPTPVGTDTDWVRVSISDGLACAQKTDDTLWCWGDPTATGTGGVDTTGIPTEVSSDTDWTWFDVAWDHACAGKSGGRVFCWGTDSFGLEVLPGQIEVDTPTEMSQTWDDIRLGGHHYCGLDDGKWYCWGWNDAGQLGVGDTITTDAPDRALCVPPPN